jgi:hypothetical protein
MSNDSKNANVNERSGSGKNDTNRPNDTAQKTGQQSQDAARHQNDKAHQHGASDNKSGQQSQGGGSHKDSGGMKQGGSGHTASDQKQQNDSGHKGGQPK